MEYVGEIVNDLRLWAFFLLSFKFFVRHSPFIPLLFTFLSLPTSLSEGERQSSKGGELSSGLLEVDDVAVSECEEDRGIQKQG